MVLLQYMQKIIYIDGQLYIHRDFIKELKKHPKQTRSGYDKGYVEGYNKAIDDATTGAESKQ